MHCGRGSTLCRFSWRLRVPSTCSLISFPMMAIIMDMFLHAVMSYVKQCGHRCRAILRYVSPSAWDLCLSADAARAATCLKPVETYKKYEAYKKLICDL